jgi:hypothetical protein
LVEFVGYGRGKRKGNLVPSEANVAKKPHYLRTFFSNRAKPPTERLREVYADGSYIHEQYHRNDEDSLFDRDDDEDVIYQKEKHKGHRYCFCAAIQGPNPLGGKASEHLAGLLPGSIWAFCPQKKGDHLGDYHKVFNGGNYIPRFRDLANLHQPSLIMLDNAAYHCVYGEGSPSGTG